MWEKKVIGLLILLVFVTAGFLALRSVDYSVKKLWLTPAQEYQYFANRQDYKAAAKAAVDSMQKGSALYRAGLFKEAAAVFGAVNSSTALYNRGNSFVMLGKYDLAIADYEKVLEKQPSWQEATDNLELARLRKEKMAPPEDDYGGTDGKLGADEIVIDDRKNDAASDQTETGEEQVDSPLNANEQQALWLRKVQTRPADFLRLKFSHQLTTKTEKP